MRRTLATAAFAAAILTLPTFALAGEETSGAFTGAAAGAVTGAVVGGPVGAAIGAGVGGTVGAAAGPESERERERVYIEEERAPARETTCVEGRNATQCVETR
jgi:phage tail tape-measure protein